MTEVDDYIATLTPDQQLEFKRLSRLVQQTVPSVTQGKSYGMAAFLYQGKPLISFVANKNFLSLYPFSGKVLDKLSQQLANYERTSGSIHFSLEQPITDALLKAIITTRQQEIEERILKSSHS